jgi:hypothetical protein
VSTMCLRPLTQRGPAPVTEPTGLKRCPCPEHEGPNPLPVDGWYRSKASPDGFSSWCRTCIKRIVLRRKLAVRNTVFDHYGHACSCCGATDDLTIDHINGDGQEHRLTLFGRNTESVAMYRWLITNGFPSGFQILCGPCNASKKSSTACRLDHSGNGAKNCPCPEHEGSNPLPLEAFPEDSARRSGRSSWCRMCHNRAARTIWKR